MGIEALGEKTFLKLLTAQLQFQDPLKPMESTDFIAQLAQFREMESAIETNKKLEALTGHVEVMNSLSATGLLGRNVEVIGGGITHDVGRPETISYKLPEDAKEIVIYVNDSAGNVVRTLTMKGLQTKGTHELVWDGRDNHGNPVPAGNYTYDGALRAKDTDKTAPLDIHAKGEVTGISYEGGKVLASVNGTYVPVEKIAKVLR